MKQPAVLLHMGAGGDPHPWVLRDERVRAAYQWHHQGVQAGGSLARVRAGWRGAKSVRHGVIVTTEYFVAFGVNLRFGSFSRRGLTG